ncbi:hypothetical protein [Virgibacillus litoralis]|uniref:Uncharacterized protein n=1 Tax=Virgibacillus litoralis TaxID=578221 RepID=A0ABS4HIN5_9BACI|nr:hypothetical protein [Virgibacillus litoralis]MBP1950748.1 hypothetical protein [Virgibacillus litoralis]
MESERIQTEQEQFLRVALPDLYSFLMEEVEKHYNIHPYDIQAHVIKDSEQYQLIFYYGDGFAHQKSKSFSHEAVERMGEEMTDFSKELGEACKEVMIADYFKMMKM